MCFRSRNVVIYDCKATFQIVVLATKSEIHKLTRISSQSGEAKRLTITSLENKRNGRKMAKETFQVQFKLNTNRISPYFSKCASAHLVKQSLNTRYSLPNKNAKTTILRTKLFKVSTIQFVW